jgi:hypothetical protein
MHAPNHRVAPHSVVNLRLQEPEAALVPLRKLHALLPDQPEAAHCIALAHDMMGDAQVAAAAAARTCSGDGPAAGQAHGSARGGAPAAALLRMLLHGATQPGR